MGFREIVTVVLLTVFWITAAVGGFFVTVSVGFFSLSVASLVIALLLGFQTEVR